MYYLFNFILYSIFGFMFEVITKSIFKFTGDSGVLFGPWCPVYGFGITFIFFLFIKLKQILNINILLEVLLFFLISFILLTLFEFIGGILIQKISGIVFWDYTDFKFNIGKYISLEMSLVWGVISLLVFYFLKPITDKLYLLVDKNIILIFIIIFIFDLIIKLFLDLIKKN